MADFIVLTKGAQKITGTEENGPGSAGSDQGCFFSEMTLKTRHAGFTTGAADTDFSRQPIGPTVPGAETAIAKQVNRRMNTILQPAVPI